MSADTSVQAQSDLKSLDVALDRDLFTRTLIRELAGTLQDIIGMREASGFVSIVGQRVGRQIDGDFKRALGVEKLTRPQVAAVLVELKRRIQGDFRILEESDEKIVLANRACPFGEKVLGRPSMCMMTSNVFGAIAAQNLGYAKVELQQTIADGHPGCHVVVHLQRTPDSDTADGREYFKPATE